MISSKFDADYFKDDSKVETHGPITKGDVISTYISENYWDDLSNTNNGEHSSQNLFGKCIIGTTNAAKL